MYLHTFDDEMKRRFGGKVYRIALSTGFSCPNRDGTVGTGGCAFCTGSGEFAEAGPIDTQLARAKARVRQKLPPDAPGRFVAYFQSFSNTYGPPDVQRRLFSAALADPEVVALSVATRPDCLPPKVLDLLSSLMRDFQKPVWVELGLQTANEETARRLNRCFDNAVFERAVRELNARGMDSIVHLILGLPGETHEDEIRTLSYVSALPVDGVKFHLLHVLRGTPLAEWDYTPLTREEYVFRLTDLLRRLPPHITVHRMTGDGDKKSLIAPLWSADKKGVLNAIARALRESDLHQGELLPFADRKERTTP